jgi:O-acetyl-ADP-ribose deacetylase (regulator of RNase III)
LDGLDACQREARSPMGCVFPHKVNDNLIIMNAITQEFYGRETGKQYVSYQAIYKAFDKIAKYARVSDHPKTVNYPLIGAGLGGGDWAIISNIIDSIFQDARDLHTLGILE